MPAPHRRVLQTLLLVGALVSGCSDDASTTTPDATGEADVIAVEDGGDCSNPNFLNEKTCVEAGHEWTEPVVDVDSSDVSAGVCQAGEATCSEDLRVLQRCVDGAWEETACLADQGQLCEAGECVDPWRLGSPEWSTCADDPLATPESLADKAAQHYEKSLSFDAAHPGALMRLAELALRKDDWDRALSYAKRAISVGEDIDAATTAHLQLIISISLGRTGHIEGAAAALVEAEKHAEVKAAVAGQEGDPVELHAVLRSRLQTGL